MGSARDPYEVLGVSRKASQSEIRAAYRELVKRYHPDKHRANPLEDLAVERLAEINQAYAKIGDPNARERNDSAGPAGVAPADGTGRRARGDAGFSTRSTRSPALTQIFKFGWTILALTLFAKFGVVILREVFALLRLVFQGLMALRANPLALLIVVVVVFVVYASFRRRGRSS